ncbi:PAS domain-containing protein [Aquimarina algiphila]|uniref:histidine kinase n=1 Tax=Aquimarina algiphila TaxID=2047982 RepID=A0A554VLW5_9FLAO|nr:PAS domain S-box protein [Aquimarina algiphila]TSE09174.1 PAS domain S-box protein [Aquimarina algiphila]
MYQNSKQSLGTVEYDENYLKEELYNLLKQDKSIFDFIQNSALDGLWFWDLEYPENEWMNPKFWITLGYDPNQMPHLSSTWQNIINQDDLALALDNFNDHCEDPSCPYDQIVRYTHKLGHTVWIHCRGIIIRDSKGKPTRMLGAHTDVTKLKKTELKLRHQVERYQHIIESTDLGTWEWNMQIDRLICNERWAEILGFTLLELEPITMDTFKKSIHPSDLEKFEKNVAQHFIGETLFYKFEVRVKHKNGEWIWVLNRGKIVSWTKQDEPEWIIRSLQEITQSKKDLEKHKLFIEQAPSAIAMFDKNMCYIAHSKKWKVDYSISEENIIGKSHYEIFPEIGENWKKDHQNCLSGKILSSDEDRFEREDGSVQWLSWKLHPWYKSNNEVGGIIMLTTDITKIKDTEIQLRLSEKKFRENFENAAIGMAILDLKGKWLEVNDTLCSIVGYTSEELLGLTFQDITYSDDLSKDLELFQELLDGDRSYYHMEKRYLHKKGHIVHVILSASIIRDENEKPLYFISQITDITLRVNANQKLKETLAQLEGVLEASTQVSIIETNLEGVITKFNKGAENLLGYKRDEVINKETVKLIHLDEEVLEYGYELSKELGKEINGYDIIETPLNRQKHLNKEWTYVKKDGTKFPVQLATTAIKINNSITGYLRVATNISEIKEVEKEIKSLLQVAMNKTRDSKTLLISYLII